jgi:hypothetical protein
MLYKYGFLYFNDYYGISCLNARDGTVVWYTYLSREDLSQGISYAYGRIYVVNEAGVLYVLDSPSGAKLSYYEFGNQLHSIPTPYNGSLYVAGNDWNLYCFGEARLLTEAPKPSVITQASAAAPAATAAPIMNIPVPAPANQVSANTQNAIETSSTTYFAITVAVIAIATIVAVLILRRRK